MTPDARLALIREYLAVGMKPRQIRELLDPYDSGVERQAVAVRDRSSEPAGIAAAGRGAE